MTVRDDYLAARINMEKVPVPNRLLRGYLDNLRLERKWQNGLHPVKIVVTRTTTPDMIHMFLDAEQNGDVDLEVRG